MKNKLKNSKQYKIQAIYYVNFNENWILESSFFQVNWIGQRGIYYSELFKEIIDAYLKVFIIKPVMLSKYMFPSPLQR